MKSAKEQASIRKAQKQRHRDKEMFPKLPGWIALLEPFVKANVKYIRGRHGKYSVAELYKAATEKLEKLNSIFGAKKGELEAAA